MAKLTRNTPWILALCGLPVMVFALVLWKRTPEPTYQGKPISHWIERAASGQHGEFYDAVKQIGTNALPYVIAAVATQDSRWQNIYRRRYQALPQSVQQLLPKPKVMLDGSVGATAIILTRPASIPYAIAMLKDSSPSVRSSMAWSFRSTSLLSSEVIPHLIDATRDPDQRVRAGAVVALGSFGTEAAAAVEAITEVLTNFNTSNGQGNWAGTRGNAARTLGQIGAPARNAVPLLHKAMLETDAYLRSTAAAAVWRITSNANHSLPTLLQAFPALDQPLRWDLVIVLGEMGPQAKAAVPILIGEARTNSDFSIRRYATNALIQIDPDAATAAGIAVPKLIIRPTAE